MTLATPEWPLDDCAPMHELVVWLGRTGIETMTGPAHESVLIWRLAPERSVVAPPIAQQIWMLRVWERLQALQELPENWNGYGESPVALEAVAQTAELLVDIGPTQPMPDIVPLCDGGLQIEWSDSSRELEIEVGPQGARTAFFVDDEGREQEFEVSAEDVPEIRTLVAAMG